MLALTLFDAHNKPQGRRVLASWELFFKSVERPGRAGVPKDFLPGWSPALFTGDYRTKTNVEKVYALVLDYDNKDIVTTFEQAVTSWSAGYGVIYSTYQHTKLHPRFRVVLGLTRPVTGPEYEVIWSTVAKRLAQLGQEVDGQTKDPSRFWYVPAFRPHYRTWRLTGKLIDVDQLLVDHRPEAYSDIANGTKIVLNPSDMEELKLRASAYLKTIPGAISGQGGHVTTLKAASVLTRGFGLDDGTALALLRIYNERCEPPWSEKELKHKLRSAVRYEKKPMYFLLER